MMHSIVCCPIRVLQTGCAALAWAVVVAASVSAAEPAVPVFADGEAQVVNAFEDSDYWIRHDLWVETEFDSDGDREWRIR